jgi:hypothetical protein
LLRSRGPMARFQRQLIRFQRQPPGTAITRTSLILGGGLAGAGAWLVVAREPGRAAVLAGLSGVLLLIGGHRANHGAGGPTDRMLEELLDRGWDAAMLGSIAWAARVQDPRIAAGALVALCVSFLSAYVRARGAALGYSVEESHVTRGIRYALIVAGLGFGWLGWTVWVAAGVAALAALVRTGQVASEDRT